MEEADDCRCATSTYYAFNLTLADLPLPPSHAKTDTMFSQRVVLALLAILAVAAAFRSPVVASRVATRAMALSMSPADAVTEQAPALMSQFSQVLAAEADFGGYAGPVGSLLFIAAIILVLAPPLASKQE